MARYTATCVTTGGSTTLPVSSIYSSTTERMVVRQIDLSNTSNTAMSFKLTRLTSLGTAATTLTIAPHDLSVPASTCTARNSHTANPGLGADIATTQLGASQGAGFVWVFGSEGLVVPKDAGAPASGLGILLVGGSINPLTVTWYWDL